MNAINCLKLLKETLTPSELDAVVKINIGRLLADANKNGFYELSKEILGLSPQTVSEFIVSVIKESPMLIRSISGDRMQLIMELLSQINKIKKKKDQSKSRKRGNSERVISSANPVFRRICTSEDFYFR